MSLIAAHFPVLIAVVLFCLAAFMAFLMDYLKAYNDQLRERNIELSARQRERDRWLGKSPEAFVEKIAALLRTAQAMPATALPVGAASVRARQRAATYGPTPPSEPQSVAEPVEAVLTENGTGNHPEHVAIPAENVAVQEPAAEALQDPATPVAIEDSRRGRSKQRREPARIESWVSKEELEKLAERAARIRARYGAMAGEETQEPVPVAASQEDAVSAEVRESAEPQTESVPQAIAASDPPAEDSPDSAKDSQWTFRESVGPFANPDAQPSAAGDGETANASQNPLEQVGEEQVGGEAPSGLSLHSLGQHENHLAKAVEPAPELWSPTPESEEPSIWAIPSTPAQAAVSAHLTGWQPEPLDQEIREAPETREDQEAPSNVTEFPSPGGPIHDLSLAEMTGYEPGPYMPENPAERTQNDIDLDALFDQTYGSPSWLSIGTQESGGAVTSVLPTGLFFEGTEFGTLMADAPSFTGVAVSIRINDFASVKPKLSAVEGVEALGALDNLIRSLLREDRDFAGKAEEDEYVLLFPGDTGDEGQRRLFHLSERLWDFQLRSLGGLALMLSWGGLEVEDRPVPDAVSAARDRLEESRRGRAKPGSTFRSARRVS